jgi:hypothetical protein
MTTHAALSIPASNLGDVSAGDVAGRDMVRQGLDGDQVVELLGGRLERQLERIGNSLTWFVAVAAVQTAVLLLVAVLILSVLLGDGQVAGNLKNLISVRF